MVKVGILLIVYILEILKYEKAYKLFFSKELKRKLLLLPVELGLLFFLLLSRNIPDSGKYLIVYVVVLISVFLMMRDRWYKKIGNLVILLFIVNVIDLVIDNLIQFIRLLIQKESKELFFDSLIMSTVTLLVLVIIINYKDKILIKFNDVWNIIYRNIHYLVILMAFLMLVTISGLDYAEKQIANDRFSFMVFLLCVSSYVCMGIIGIFILYIRRTNNKMNEMLQNEVMLKDMQKHYYEALLEKEEDTRRYRHDMENHLLSLKGLADQEDIDELKKYLKNIQQQMLVIQKKSFVTGNQILDVLTNYYLGSLQDVKIKISGYITEKLEIDNASLCTIYANLIKNAVEELNRSKNREKYLNIKFIQGSEYFRMIIQNSLSAESSKKENILVTEKTDKKNHGIGLGNVSKTIKEHGGKLEINHNNDFFTVEVTLKMTVQEVK